MISPTALRMLLVAGELLAGSTLVMAFAWACARRGSASARHLVWASAFGAAVLLPLLIVFLPSPLRILLPSAPELTPARLTNGAAPAALVPSIAAGIFSLSPAKLAFVLAGLWIAGVAGVALRFAAGVLCLARLKQRSRPFACAPEDLPKIAATRRECELRLAESDYGPVTWGVLNPIILLPRTAVFWPRQRLHAVLLHELAHIRRRDSAVQALCSIACALYWPNPFVWLGARALRREAEMAADDAVILAGLKPSSYAHELLHLAAEFQARQPAFSALSLFMAAPSSLETRVESVLEPTALRTGVSRMDVIRAAAAGVVAASAIALVTPSLAQDESHARVIQSAPLPPPPPAVPAIPDAPPAPPVPAMPPALPAPPAPVEPAMHIHVAATPHERKCLRATARRAEREARAAVAQAGPEIARAMDDAHVDREVARALDESRPDIDAAMAQSKIDVPPDVRRALAQARTEIARARLQSTINERVEAVLRHAQARIEAAETLMQSDRSDAADVPDSGDN